MLAPLLILAQATGTRVPGPDLDQLVSIEAKGVSGVGLAEAMSKLSGIAFTAHDEAAADHFIVSADRTPLRELMARVAEAENGKWVQTSDAGFELDRDAEKTAAYRERRLAACRAGFARTLARFAKESGAAEAFDGASAHRLADSWKQLGKPPESANDGSYWERQNSLAAAEPAGRALHRVLATFSADVLASVPEQRRIVFSSAPTSMQEPLPDGAAAAIEEFSSEQRVWADTTRKYLSGSQVAMYYDLGRESDQPATVALVCLTRWSQYGEIQAEFKLADADGNVVGSAYGSIPMDPATTAPKPVAGGAPPPIPKPPPPLALPALDVEAASCFNRASRTDESRRSAPSAALFNLALEPERVDPLSTFASDGLIGLARREKRNFAAVLDEDCLYPLASCVTAAGMAGDGLNRLWGCAQERPKGWIVVRPDDPDAADRVRCDRAALGTLCRAVRDKGRATLEDAAAYATSAEDFNENAIAFGYLEVVADDGWQTLLRNDKRALQFYGELGPVGPKGLVAPISRLTPAAMKDLDELVFGEYPNLQVLASSPAEGQPVEAGWNSILREPTCSLPGGIPRDGEMQVVPTESTKILAVASFQGSAQGESAYDPAMLASMMEGDPGGPYQWTVSRMRSGDERSITFNFQLTPLVRFGMSLTDTKPTSKWVNGANGLPADLAQAMNRALKDVARERDAQQSRRVEGGGGAPP